MPQRIRRDKFEQTPLKQNIRLWFDYLKVAIEEKYDINKEYYKDWHLNQVRRLSFIEWWSSHKQLFAHKQFINVRVLNELSLNDAMKEVKKQLVGKVDKRSKFHIDSERFRYKPVDDYLKCWKLRERKKLYYVEIAKKLNIFYQKKRPQYKEQEKKIKGRLKRKLIPRVFNAEGGNLLHIVRRKVETAKVIIKNTAKGQFTGKY